MKQIKLVQLEVQDLAEGDNRIMYEGAMLKEAVIHAMQGHGFVLLICHINGSVLETDEGLKEVNCFFMNNLFARDTGSILKEISARRSDSADDFTQAYEAWQLSSTQV